VRGAIHNYKTASPRNFYMDEITQCTNVCWCAVCVGMFTSPLEVRESGECEHTRSVRIVAASLSENS